MDDLQKNLLEILDKYRISFTKKVYNNGNTDHDILMDVFGITPQIKDENKQYWGRELGFCWQLLIIEVAKATCSDYQPALKIEGDEPTDLFIGNDAIDTKYRIGSGDSGTLKKFRTYGKLLKGKGYNPVLLILRDDNLPAAIKAVQNGGWDLYIGEDCLDYIYNKTNFDIKSFLHELKNEFLVKRVE